MTDVSRKVQRAAAENESVGQANTSSTSAAASPRAPYEAPRLRYLGSVKDLTWGTGGSGNDDFQQQLP
jgi:hypothetical protein